ncbi:MAG: BF2992 family fimbrillin-A clan protein, partial [Bacteroidales bacterium]
MKSYIYILLILILSGCTNELYDNPKEEELSKNGIPVNFSISNSIFSKSGNRVLMSDAITLSGSDTIPPHLNNIQTKSISPIPAGSTIRVIAYKRKSSGSTPNTANDIFISSQSYQLTSSNILTPVNVNSDGEIISGNASEMYLTSGEYDFYAYSPAIPMLNDSTVAINQ